MTCDWRPIIDTGRCKDQCFACAKFCPQRVYSLNGPKPTVTNPNACVKGCDACRKVCPEGAISFISTRTLTVDGVEVGILGLDDALKKNDFESAFNELCKFNYIPKEARMKLKEAVRKEFEKRSK
ncbi:MAG: ferredoxin family protein [Candidatus Woesearchaeota archaeon]